MKIFSILDLVLFYDTHTPFNENLCAPKFDLISHMFTLSCSETKLRHPVTRLFLQDHIWKSLTTAHYHKNLSLMSY